MTGDVRAQLQQALGGAYTLDRELGGGGMSRVFVATEHALARQVVVKVLPSEMAGQVSVERFKREISLAARLQHPHIVTLLTAGDAGGLPFFTMPLIAGESLRARLSKHGELPLNEAVRLLREIGAALAYAHEHGIVHRDIKPDNVLLSGGSAMVTDFGVAKALSSSSNAEEGKATSLGVALGTPAYMSPEQASADPNVDHRADIYAFGVLAYELLTGQPPFVGRTPQNLLAAHVTEAPEHVTKRRATIPPALAALVMRCLEKRAADRPQTANEVVHGLDQINTPSGGTHPTNAVPAYATPQPASPPTRSHARMVGSIVGIVAIAAAAWFALVRDGGSGPPRSIAVLPTDIGSDTAHAYLADGLSSEITTKLTKIPGLEVRAYSSSKVMRGKGAKEAGSSLKVAAVVMASMTRMGTQLRVTASLVSASDERVLWSDSFTESDQNQFALQDKLVAAITGALRISLSPATVASVTARGTRSSEAHELVQRARFMTDQFTKTSLLSAVTSAESAIAIDSTYADAWASLAEAWGYLADDFVAAAEAAPKLKNAAERALAIDPSLADAHALVATWLFYYGHDPASAAPAFERALQLDSTNATAGIWYANLLRNGGLPGDSSVKADSARAVSQRTLRHNPLSLIVWNNVMPGASALGRLSSDSAAAVCSNAVRVSDRLGAHCEARRHFAAKQYREAAAALRRAVGGAPSGRELALLSLQLFDVRDTVGARDALRQAVERSRTEYVREDFIADAFLRLGDRERAIVWMVKAGEANAAGITFLESDPLYAPIRSDPRIQAIIKRIKRPQ